MALTRTPDPIRPTSWRCPDPNRSTYGSKEVDYGFIRGRGGCSFWLPVQADSQPKSSGLVLGRRPLGAILHSSNEPGELSQLLCHDDSTINIVVLIIIIIIIRSIVQV